MKFVFGVIDKLLFGCLLLVTLQVPVLADQYLQYIAGYYAGIGGQVSGFEANARMHGYNSVYAMIDDLLASSSSVVRIDAEQKLATMAEYEEIRHGLETLRNGNYFEQSWYMFNPDRYRHLEAVLGNFEPGVPLGTAEIGYSIILTIALYALLALPCRYAAGAVSRRRRRTPGQIAG